MNKLFFSALVLTCSNAFAQITNPSPYCDGGYDDGFGPLASTSDAIQSVSIGTLVNNSGVNRCAAPYYIYYNNLAQPNLEKGNTYTFSVTLQPGGGAGYGVWIDYIQNNSFEANEEVVVPNMITNVNQPSTFTHEITIPTTALVGVTRMRVRFVEDDNYTMLNWQQGQVLHYLPCNISTSATDIMDWGETEDYNVMITGTAGVDESMVLARLSINESILSVKDVSVERLFLYAMNGQQVGASDDAQLDVSSLKSGIYLLKIETTDGAVLEYKIAK